MHRACEAKWWQGYALGLKAPSSPWQILGSALHEEIEEYLVNQVTPESSVAVAMLPYLPEDLPWPRDLVEHRFDYEALELKGVIDLIDHRDGELRITDHKFYSGWGFVDAPEEELLIDTQLIVYSLYAMHMFDEDRCWFRWLFGNKKNNQARPREVTVTRSWAEKQFSKRVLPVMTRMKEIEHETSPENIKFDGAPLECGKYRGCFHRSRCLAWGVNVSGHSGMAQYLQSISNEELS